MAELDDDRLLRHGRPRAQAQRSYQHEKPSSHRHFLPVGIKVFRLCGIFAY
jgi:hypothetical protein